MKFDQDDPRLTAFVLGELDLTERAVIEACLIESADCREAVEEIRLTTRWLSEQLQEESRAHHPVEKAGINNHHAGGVVVAKSDSPRTRWWGRPAIRMNLIAAAVLALVGLAVVPFVRVDVQPRRTLDEHIALKAGGGGAAKAKAKPDWDRFGEAAPGPATFGAVPVASAPAPLPGADARGEGVSRSLGLIQGAEKAGGRTGRCRTSRTGCCGGYAKRSARGHVGRGGREQTIHGERQDAREGERIRAADAAGSSGVVVAAPEKSIEGEKKEAQTAGRGALLAMRMRGGLAESTDKRPQQKNIKGAVPSAAIDGYEAARAGAMPEATRSEERLDREQRGRKARRPRRQPRRRHLLLVVRSRSRGWLRCASRRFMMTWRLRRPLGEVQNGAVNGQDDQKPEQFAFKAPQAAGNATAPKQGKDGEMTELQAGLGRDLLAQRVAAEEKEQVAADKEGFAPIVENAFQLTSKEQQSTFSIDVDTASYSNDPAVLEARTSLPPRDAVRIEEMLNYFPYDDSPPADASDHPFAVHVEVGGLPVERRAPAGADRHRGQTDRSVATAAQQPGVPGGRVGLDGRRRQAAAGAVGLAENGRAAWRERPGGDRRLRGCIGAGAAVDVLHQEGRDHVGDRPAQGRRLDQRRRGHSARVRRRHTELHQERHESGDPGDRRRLQRRASPTTKSWSKLITEKAKSGVFLSVLGFGMGNIKDAKLEKLADKGNGHYAYIDSPREAYKVLVEEMGSTLVTVAKDVKIQVEFNPAKVGAYPADRLRKPGHGARGLQRRHEGRGRDRGRAPRDGALRAGAGEGGEAVVVAEGDAKRSESGKEPGGRTRSSSICGTRSPMRTRACLWCTRWWIKGLISGGLRGT